MEALFNIKGGGGGGSGGGKGSGKGGPPDLASILGSTASGLDNPEMRKMADELWKHLDGLAATDPAAYRSFLEEQAKDAGMPAPPMLAQQDSGFAADALPALVLEASISGARVPPGALALVHVWSAKADAAVALPTTAGCQTVCAETASWVGLQVPLRTHRAPTTTPHKGNRMIYSYHLLCHAQAVHLAAVRTPAALCPLLVEAVCQFVEHSHSVKLSRTARRLQVNVEALPVGESAQHKADHKSAALARAASGTSAEALSTGLLSELSTFGLTPAAPPEATATATAVLGGGSLGQPKGKPLIVEVKAAPTAAPAPASAARSEAVSTSPAAAAPPGKMAGPAPAAAAVAAAAVAAAAAEASAAAAPAAAAAAAASATATAGVAGAACAATADAAVGAAHPGLQVVVVPGADGAQCTVVVTAHLPHVERAGEVDVDVSDGCVRLSTAGAYGLELSALLPREVDAAAARAKFDVKRRVLTVRLPAL